MSVVAPGVASRTPVERAVVSRALVLAVDAVGNAAEPARWGRLNVPDLVPTIDGMLAATALVHSLTLVTRNTRDVRRTGVRHLDPFA
jgi:predicted nucleic acid-binding protein